MDEKYEAPALEWDHEKAVKFYKHYMRQFWGKNVKPYDRPHRERLGNIFRTAWKNDKYTVGLLAKDKNEFLRIGATYLMCIGKRVFWQYFDATSLVNSHLGGDLPLNEVNEYEYVIVSFHGGAHRPLPRFMDLLVTDREIKRLHTLVLSTADTEWLGTPLFDPFVELDGAYKWPYTWLDRTGVTIRQRSEAIRIVEGSTRSTTELPEFKETGYTSRKQGSDEPRQVKPKDNRKETRADDTSQIDTAGILPGQSGLVDI